MIEMVMPFAVFAFAAFILYAIFSIVNDMAIARGQNPWPWLFLALVWSPFGSMFVLWMFYDVQDDDAAEGEA